MKNKLLIFIFAFCFLNFESAQSANYYWVGGTGNWSNYSVHWATTSGGNVFHVQVPTSFDNVYFDANSFTANGQIVTNDTTIAYCRDMDWTGAMSFPFFEAANTAIELKIFGSLTLNPVVNFVFNGHLTFTSFNPGKTIQTFSHIFQCPIEFNGAGGEWTLIDSLTTIKDIKLTYGTVRTNNNNIGCNAFNSYNNNARALYLGTSTVRLAYGSAGWAWDVSSSLIIDADSSIIRLRDNGYFYAIGHTYNIIQWDSTGSSSTSNVLAHDSLRINKVISLNSAVTASLRIEHLGTSRIDSIIAMGSLYIRFGGFNFFKSVFVNHDFYYDNDDADSVISMTVNGNATFYYYTDNANHYLHNFFVHGNLVINEGNFIWPNSQTFDSCYVGGNATILSGSNHMGVFTMTPGKTLTLKNDSTQYIDSLSATGNPGFPIQIISSDLGLAANVVIQKDLCTNYLYIHAVHAATSPGFLFVGPNSNDVANNSGWIFANCITGMEENYDGSLSLYPNPATNQLTIDNGKLKMEIVEIYDLVGQSVFSQQQTTNNKQQTVDVSQLTPGIYFIKIKGGQHEQVARFVKQ